MSLTNAKTYGGIGAILSLLGGFIPRVGSLVTLLGLVLLLFAVKEIADEIEREDIFRDYLVGVILRFGALIVLILALVLAIGFAVLKGAPFKGMEEGFEGMRRLLAPILIGGLLAWILFVLGTYYTKKSYEKISSEVQVDTFKTVGFLYFVGGILLIALGIGLLVLLIGKILEIVAYFSLPESIKKEEVSEKVGG